MGSAKDVMRTAVPTVGPSDSLARAAEIMDAFSARELPVVSDDGLIGMLARSDLAPHVGQLEWTPVRLAMSSPARTVTPDAPIGEVARALIDGHFNGIPVVVGNTLAGIITRHDLVRLLLES